MSGPVSLADVRQALEAPRSLFRAHLARVLVAAIAGIALAGTAAPWNQRWLLPVAVSVAVLAFRSVRPEHALLLGYVFGAAYLLTLTAWMRAVGPDAWLLVSLVGGSFYSLLAATIASARTIPAWPICVACLWAAAEAVMSVWPLGGFPWARLVWRTVDTPLAEWLPWIGAPGVSFLAVLGGTVLAWLVTVIRPRPGTAAAVAGMVVAGIATPTVVTPASFTEAWVDGAPAATVAVVQGGVPGAGNDVVAVHRQVTVNHVIATMDLADRVAAGGVAQPDFVLWPENSTAVDPFTDAATRSGIDAAAAAIGAPIIVGAIIDGSRPDAVLNQGIVWAPDGGVGDRYTKRHPVPFGEYLPFRSWLSDLQIGRLDMVPRDMIPGSRTVPLEVGGVRVADLICFDVAFDDSVVEQVREGAQMVAVQTSNATFVDTAQPEQQFAITRLRAMETGRYVAVASTNGVSGFIRPDGTVQGVLPPRDTGVAVEEIPLLTATTLAVRIAPTVQALILVVAAGVILLAMWRRSPLGNGSRQP